MLSQNRLVLFGFLLRLTLVDIVFLFLVLHIYNIILFMEIELKQQFNILVARVEKTRECL